MRPPYPFCWNCGRRFQGNHFGTAKVDGRVVFAHKQCVDEMSESFGERFERLVIAKLDEVTS